MTIGVLVIFATCIISGIGVTMYSGIDMSLEERIFGGWAVGIVVFTLCGMLSTRLFDFNGPAVLIAALLALAVSARGWLRGWNDWFEAIDDFKRRLALPIRSGQNPVLLLALLVPVWILIGRIFYFAYQGLDDGGMQVGHLAGWSDWHAHLTYTASFAFADNTALNLPTATGYNLGYHAGINYFAALLIPGGASLHASLQLSSAFAIFAFPGVMYSVGMRVFRSQATALLGSSLFLFFGGWGFLEFFRELGRDLGEGEGRWDILTNARLTYTRLPTEAEGNFWLENPIVGHFYPQRPTVIGFPLVLLILSWLYTAWSRSQDDGVDTTRTFIFCGVLIGLTPFFNLFAFGTPLVFVLVWWLFTRFDKRWLLTLVPAAVLAAPFVLFLRAPSSSVKYPYDWVGNIIYGGNIPDRSAFTAVADFVVFWARNFGFWLPLLVAALAIPGIISRRVAIGLLPVWLMFIGPNIVSPHPWNGNNTHYFIFVLLLGALPIAALLVHAVRRVPLSAVAVVPIVLTLTLAGFLDVVAAADRTSGAYPTVAMDGPAVAVGEWARTTDPDSVFAIEVGFAPGDASGHIHPVPALSGRDVVIGFDGWVFDLGIPDWVQRRQHTQEIFEALPGWEEHVERYDVDYLVIGPTERTPQWDPNYTFWEGQADVVYRNAGWTVYEL